MNTQQIIAKAKANGSTATTLKGAARFLLANHRPAQPINGLLVMDWQMEHAFATAVAVGLQQAGVDYMSEHKPGYYHATGYRSTQFDSQQYIASRLTRDFSEDPIAVAIAAAITEAAKAVHAVNCRKPYMGYSRDQKLAWLDKVAARKSNPEAKRARDDRKLRPTYLRRLAREQAKLVAPPVGTIDEITAAADSRATRNLRLEAIAALRSIVFGKPQPAAEAPKVTAGVKVGGFDAPFAKKHGASIDMRGKDATINATRRHSYGNHSAGETEWKNGNPVNYTRATHDNYVRSLALVRQDGVTVDYVFHETRAAVALLDGCRWDVDGNGLRAVRGPDDFHPSPQDLLAKDAAQKIVAKLEANAGTRAKLSAEALAQKAEMEGVYVCVADSCRAGNCVAGTKNFAQRHGLDTRKHYSAMELLAMANGDAGRVRLAIRAACNRHQTEMERGFANIAEHQVAM